jgi:hypothetical protein
MALGHLELRINNLPLKLTEMLFVCLIELFCGEHKMLWVLSQEVFHFAQILVVIEL